MLVLMADTYTVAQAAKVLDVTPKRVRQLIADGRLSVVAGTSPQRLDARAVHRHRDERAKQAKAKPGPSSTSSSRGPVMAVSDVLEMFRAEQARAIEAQESNFQQALAARDRVEELLRDELAQARAEVERLRQQQAAAPSRRGWLRRS
jgi:hypothetical protein